MKLFKPGLLLLFSLSIFSCMEPSLPKQHAYPRIDFPIHTYENWHVSGTPYSFEKPVYSIMQLDSADAHWYNLTYLPFNATLHLSYHTFSNQMQLDTLIHDTRNLVYKHTVKASDIIDNELKDSNGRSGMFYALEGETATPCNFYLTDNKSKFFRGALYFNSYTTIDSVGPVVDFIKQDIGQMIKSFKFE
jgi:gliding motility-associated lipoprotein GldD